MRRWTMLMLVLVGLWMPLRAFGQYTYVPVDVPWESNGQVQVTGLGDKGNLVGKFLDMNWTEQGWMFKHKSGQWQIVQQKGFPPLAVEDTNRSGDTWGSYLKKGKSQAFLKTSGGLKTITVPGASMTWGFGVNDNRQGVGSALLPDGCIESWLYDAVANFRLDFSIEGACYTEARGVNNASWVSGWFQDASGTTHGFVMDIWSGDTLVIDAPCGGTWSSVADINDKGLMAVLCGGEDWIVSYAYDGTTWTELRVPDGDLTWVLRVNNVGQFGGHYLEPDGSRYGFVASPAADVSVGLR